MNEMLLLQVASTGGNASEFKSSSISIRRLVSNDVQDIFHVKETAGIVQIVGPHGVVDFNGRWYPVISQIQNRGIQDGPKSLLEISGSRTSTAAADLAGHSCHGLFRIFRQAPSPTIQRSFFGRIEQDFKGRRDTGIDIDQAMHGMQFGAFEGYHRGTIQEGAAVDAKEIHNETFDTNIVAHLQGVSRHGWR
jgi:hypothetical protein